MNIFLVLGMVLTALLHLGSCRPLQDRDEQTGATFTNTRDHDIYISIDWSADDVAEYGDQLTSGPGIISPGCQVFIPALPHTSPKYFLSSTDNSLATRDKRDHDTAVEATYQGFEGFTFFDVDFEKGFSEAVWCHSMQDGWDQGSGCDKDMLAVCPDELKHFDPVTGRLDQCVGVDTPENVAFRRQLCPWAYEASNDARTVTITRGSSEYSQAVDVLARCTDMFF